MSPDTPTASFLDHVPVALAFGTSGLRGLVKDITDLEAFVNVKGALRYLRGTGDVQPGDAVVLAGDLRPSTERILCASARAIVDAGCRVEYAGRIPTPAVILHSIATRRAGVMVSGSHIPFDRNGIKLNKTVGEVLKSDEPGIVREVEGVRREEYARTAAASPFDAAGMLKRAPELPPEDGAARERYVKRYVDAFGGRGLEGLRVLVYEHSAVGRDVLGRILRELGAEVVGAGRSDSFVPIDTENVTPELLARLEGLVAAAGGRFDAIVSTDGDSDRPLVAAVLPVGGHVQFLPGDKLGLVVARYLDADAFVVPISANDAIGRYATERHVHLERTRIGSPHVILAIDALCRAHRYARVVGWEANGGFLVGSGLTLARGSLESLPTRDSTLPILANLFAARAAGVGLADLWATLPARYGCAGLIDEVPVAVSQAILARLTPESDAVELEPDARERDLLARFFTSALGFGAVVRINVLDGLRVSFANGDVAHLRASGNAPQLRVYANSDSQARADSIVELALREPDGILRTMERELTGR